MKKISKAQILLNEALTNIESEDIRAWATSEQNLPIWLQIAKLYFRVDDAVARLTLDIVATAKGWKGV